MNRVFRFGPFELDVGAYVLRHQGDAVKLERIPMEVLILLVERTGTLVARTEIQTRLWDVEVFIEHDAAINTAIRKLRRALRDDAATPRFVETVIGKGYRFIGPIEHSAAEPRPLPRYSLTLGNRDIVLQVGDTVLGRDPEAGLVIQHPSVSRRHARISIDSKGVMVGDLGSRNGTFLNGQRIETPIRVDRDAVIAVGAVTMTLTVDHAAASTKSMAPLELSPVRKTSHH